MAWPGSSRDWRAARYDGQDVGGAGVDVADVVGQDGQVGAAVAPLVAVVVTEAAWAAAGEDVAAAGVDVAEGRAAAGEAGALFRRGVAVVAGPHVPAAPVDGAVELRGVDFVVLGDVVVGDVVVAVVVGCGVVLDLVFDGVVDGVAFTVGVGGTALDAVVAAGLG